KVLALILALVLFFACGGLTGYLLWGRRPVSNNVANSTAATNRKDLYGSADVDLSSKPKDTDEMTAAEVYAKVNPSVVGIRVYNANGAGADATGVIYTKDGYVITDDHIYADVGAPRFRIYMYDGTEYDADYVAGDKVSDLAVLKIRKPGKLQPATFGNSEQVVCGENVVAIGRPTEATAAASITKGIVSSPSRRVKTTTNYSARMIQTDAAINSGSSGGALVNMYGQVIGITSNKMPTTSGYEGTAYSIPTKTVKRICEQLISKGVVKDRAKIGITYTMIDSVTAAVGKYSVVGLYISEVGKDSDLYGKVKEGDIITHVNGTEVTDDDIVLDLIEDSKPGDQIEVTVLTGKTSKKFKIKLMENVGESSYSEAISDLPDDKDTDGKSDDDGTFDFPDGE
ncbi:MAG: S1C family serine protease, partial [Clostridia bacterium]|nr:S1C family serine protease [Clostridia bacterium]